MSPPWITEDNWSTAGAPGQSAAPDLSTPASDSGGILPSFGAAAAAVPSFIQSGPFGMITRAQEQTLATRSPYISGSDTILQPDEANAQFAPAGQKLFTQPVSRSLAAEIGRQAKETVARDEFLGQWAGNTNLATKVTATVMASIIDPTNMAALLIPGIGEEAIATNLARLGMTGLGSRIASRAISGAGTFAAFSTPIAAAQILAADQTGEDFTIRDALGQIAMNAAVGAGLHVALGSVFGSNWREADAAGLASRRADAVTTNAATRAAVSQLATGRPVDVTPIIRPSVPRPTSVELGPNAGLPTGEREGTIPATAEQRSIAVAVVQAPETQAAIQGATINRDYNVEYGAGASEDGETTYINKDYPTQLAVKTLDGEDTTISPDKYLNIHEQTERAVMEELIAHGMSDHDAYLMAHFDYATVAEHDALRADGIDPASYEAASAEAIKVAGKEGIGRPPPNLYVKPYPHDAEVLIRERERKVIPIAATLDQKLALLPEADRAEFSAHAAKIEQQHAANLQELENVRQTGPISAASDPMLKKVQASIEAEHARNVSDLHATLNEHPAVQGVGSGMSPKEQQNFGVWSKLLSSVGLTPRDLAREQIEQNRIGYAPGIPQDALKAVQEEVYEKLAEEPKAEPATELDQRLTAVQQRLSTLLETNPEIKSAITAADKITENADKQAQVYKQAGECLTGAGV